MRILVTGGAGFTGSAVCRYLVAGRGASVLNVDKLTAASNLASLDPIAASPRYRHSKADICDRRYMAALMQAFAPDAVIHLAAMTGVEDADSIGAWSLLAASTEYVATLSPTRRDRFRFVQSTGDAAADGIAMSWHRTYGLPVIVSHSAALFGPCQALDRQIPQLVLAAGALLPLAVEGNGARSRDWLHVDDHARALEAIVLRGTPGATYHVGARQQRTDLNVAQRVALVMDRYAPDAAPHRDLITFVANAPSRVQHADVDVDPSQLERDTGWRAAETFETAIARTAHWYLENEAWWRPLRNARTDRALLGQRQSA